MQMRKTVRQTVRKFNRRIVPCALAVIAGLSLSAVYATARTTDNPAETPPELAGQTTKLNDLEMTIHVNSFDSKALETIGKDFARTYALRTVNMIYKQPDKMRIDGKSSVLGDAMLIQNGTVRYYAVPKLKLHTREDLKNSPAKRQSLLEYGGLITPSALTFMQGHFVKSEAVDGVDTQVYDMTYKGAVSNSHYRVWIDPKTHVSLKRTWFDSENKLKATFYYLEPHEVSPGIWLPTRIEVKNADGVSAAVTTLEDPQVNQGLSDDYFNLTP